jgi:hypothetical protein
MFRNWLRRAVRLLAPPSIPEPVLGTRPGYVWWPQQKCWVDEAVTYTPGHASYTLIGPVHSGAHGNP